MTAELQDQMPDLGVEDVQKKPDLDVILAAGGAVTIAGVAATVRRIKAREFLSLVNILTTGLAGQLGTVMKAAQSEDPEEVQAALLGAFTVAIPQAPDEFIQFVQMITDPKVESDRAKLAIEMDNPDPDVLLDVLGLLALQEKDDLAALAGKAKAWIGKIQGAFKPTQTTAG